MVFATGGNFYFAMSEIVRNFALRRRYHMISKLVCNYLKITTPPPARRV